MEESEKWDLYVKINILGIEKKEIIDTLKKINMIPNHCKIWDSIFANLFFSFPDSSEIELYKKARAIGSMLYGTIIEIKIRP